MTILGTLHASSSAAILSGCGRRPCFFITAAHRSVDLDDLSVVYRNLHRTVLKALYLLFDPLNPHICNWSCLGHLHQLPFPHRNFELTIQRQETEEGARDSNFVSERRAPPVF